MANATAAEPDKIQVERLLTAARSTIAEVRYCWVVTPADDGIGAHARAVLDQKNGAATDLSTRWFLARRVSRKVAEIRRAGRVTLAYQHASGDAFVALSGRADLIDERAAIDSRFRPSNDYEAALAAQLLAVRVTADHLELHIRGVTAEPWGHGRTFLDRGPDGIWRLAE